MVDETKQMLDTIQGPTGTEDWFVLKNKKGKNVTHANHTQQTYMSQEITKEVFGRGKERYAVLSTQKSYDLMHSNEEFKKLANNYWFCNRELLLESGLLIPNPKVRELGKELRYVLDSQVIASEGRLKPLNLDNAIEVEICKRGGEGRPVIAGDTIGTLVKAGVMKKPTDNIYSDNFYFHDNMSSLWSSLCKSLGCFHAVSYAPSFSSSDGLAVLEKIPSNE